MSGALDRPLSLVGLRCSGKTTVGRVLAARLAVPFVDLDDELVLLYGREGTGAPATELSAGALLAGLGEPAFRALEARALAGVLDRRLPLVLATGGGCVEDPGSRDLLRDETECVWLRAGREELARRMRADRTLRPALTGSDPVAEIAALAARRDPLYRETAALEVTADDVDAGGVVERILARLAARGGPGEGEGIVT